MPNCGILGCGIRSINRSGNRPNVSLHRLPKNESKREKWLDIIGTENLNLFTKSIYICSLHFEESSFNRTLNNTILRDDAVPSRILLIPLTRLDRVQEPKHIPSTSEILSEKIQDQPCSATVMPPAIPRTSGIVTERSQDQLSSATDIVRALKIIKTLKDKCEKQRQKIKRLNEKVRRQGKKITNLKNITKDL